MTRKTSRFSILPKKSRAASGTMQRGVELPAGHFLSATCRPSRGSAARDGSRRDWSGTLPPISWTWD